MDATSGGWEMHQALPNGKWKIVENPSGDRSYFGLFSEDGKVNDQFKHGSKWRDGIRFGFHQATGSHGCIMTKRVQKVIRYRNNENPSRSDNTKYSIPSYGNLTVTD
jgi:hypothetical protein